MKHFRITLALLLGLTATPALAKPPCWYSFGQNCIGRAMYDDDADRTYWYESCPGEYFVHATFSGDQTSLICFGW